MDEVFAGTSACGGTFRFVLFEAYNPLQHSGQSCTQCFSALLPLIASYVLTLDPVYQLPTLLQPGPVYIIFFTYKNDAFHTAFLF